MGETRIFLPQLVLNRWLATGLVELVAGRLTMREEALSYRVVEAVRVVAEVTGAADPNQLIGKIKPLAHVRELGAELLGDSMVLGDNAYDVVFGWVAMPDTFVRAAGKQEAVDLELDNLAGRHQSDAQALAQFLARNL